MSAPVDVNKGTVEEVEKGQGDVAFVEDDQQLTRRVLWKLDTRSVRPSSAWLQSEADHWTEFSPFWPCCSCAPFSTGRTSATPDSITWSRMSG